MIHTLFPSWKQVFWAMHWVAASTCGMSHVTWAELLVPSVHPTILAHPPYVHQVVIAKCQYEVSFALHCRPSEHSRGTFSSLSRVAGHSPRGISSSLDGASPIPGETFNFPPLLRLQSLQNGVGVALPPPKANASQKCPPIEQLARCQEEIFGERKCAFPHFRGWKGGYAKFLEISRLLH